MKQLNNSSTPKGRKVFTRRILFFLFFFSSHCLDSGPISEKRTLDQERKQDKIEEEITTERKRMVSGTSTKSTKI